MSTISFLVIKKPNWITLLCPLQQPKLFIEWKMRKADRSDHHKWPKIWKGIFYENSFSTCLFRVTIIFPKSKIRFYGWPTLPLFTSSHIFILFYYLFFIELYNLNKKRNEHQRKIVYFYYPHTKKWHFCKYL